jgi:DNA-binding NarL/FixJ family response regulator
VVVSAQENRERVIEALDLGAMGFIPKSSSSATLASALRLVFAGGIYVPPVVAAHAQRPLSAPPELSQQTLAALHLTPREGEVLSLLMQGRPNKLIARKLNIADNTVRKHVTTVLRALRVRNRTEAVIEAARRGVAHWAGEAVTTHLAPSPRLRGEA